jgi:hypothetical protein
MKILRPTKLIAILALLFPLVMPRESVAERPSHQTKSDTEKKLDSYFVYLDQVKKICGQYPASLKAVLEPALAPEKELNCPKPLWPQLESNLHNFHGLLGFLDGWGVPLAYSSDGNTYLLRASHGYFLTDRSPANSKGKHFENPNPPPDDRPPPPKNPRTAD